jgi:hypothetical protein
MYVFTRCGGQADTILGRQGVEGMDVNEALVIVRDSADGLDPFAGEVFPAGSPYQHPRVVRALYTVLQHLDLHASLTNRKEGRLKNAGLPWTPRRGRWAGRRVRLGLQRRRDRRPLRPHPGRDHVETRRLDMVENNGTRKTV